MIQGWMLNRWAEANEANRRFAEGLLRFGYLEVMPMPVDFSDNADYIATEAELAERAARKSVVNRANNARKKQKGKMPRLLFCKRTAIAVHSAP